MAENLESYLKKLQKAGFNLTHPVLLWEAGPPGMSFDPWVPTKPGGSPDRPRAGDPIVFEVRQRLEKSGDLFDAVTVGRSDDNDLVIKDPSVSRSHFYLRQGAKGEWTLTDVGSKNGTWVGERKVAPNSPAPLPDQSQLYLGDVELVFLLAESFLAKVRERTSAGNG